MAGLFSSEQIANTVMILVYLIGIMATYLILSDEPKFRNIWPLNLTQIAILVFWPIAWTIAIIAAAIDIIKGGFKK